MGGVFLAALAAAGRSELPAALQATRRLATHTKNTFKGVRPDISPDEFLDAFKGFHRHPLNKQHRIISDVSSVTPEMLAAISGPMHSRSGQGPFHMNEIQKMSENVLGMNPFPFTLLPAVINNKCYLIPFSTNEGSVTAGYMRVATKLVGATGVRAVPARPIVVAQSLLLRTKATSPSPDMAQMRVINNTDAIIDVGNQLLDGRHGAVVSIKSRLVQGEKFNGLVVNALVDVEDAAGMNKAVEVAEHLGPTLAAITGLENRQNILSNIGDYRLARASMKVSKDVLFDSNPQLNPDKDDIVQWIADASQWAKVDPVRQVTFMKGVMNYVDAVALGTGNDPEAVMASCIDFGIRNNGLTTWKKRDSDSDLDGAIELPTHLGLRGTTAHPAIKRIVNEVVPDGKTLSTMAATAGLMGHLAVLDLMVNPKRGLMSGHAELNRRAREHD